MKRTLDLMLKQTNDGKTTKILDSELIKIKGGDTAPCDGTIVVMCGCMKEL